MELTYNNGTAFFIVESPDLLSDLKDITKMISEDVISFSITEELGKLISGTLQIHDKSGIYSKIFRNGRKFSISFGFKSWNQNISDLGINSNVSKGIRQGIRCVVETPSGSGSEGGETIYNVTFIGLEFLLGKINKIYDTGTRYDMISQAMTDAGISDSNKLIDFDDSLIGLSKNDSIMQRESPTNFLIHMAHNFGAFFVTYNNSEENPVGIFVNTKKLKTPQIKAISTATLNMDDEKNLFYNCGQASNIKSFDWQQHIGESGQGDGVSIQIVQGKAVYSHYVADSSGNVTLYQLNEQRVRNATNNGADIQKSKEILDARKFKDVIQYFDPVDSPIASQGTGFTVNVKLHGDPLIFVLQKVYFKGGFPPPLTQSSQTKKGINDTGDEIIDFYVKRVTHTFNKQEYSTDIEIVDTYNLNGSKIPPTTIIKELGGA